MDYMKSIPDNYFELAIVDPPYGINVNMNMGKRKHEVAKHKNKNWDKEIPTKEYFKELFRISKNQIIWGANNMVEELPNSSGWIFWDKDITGKVDFSAGELAYTSFNQSLKKILVRVQSVGDKRIHPTQKPVDLYKWQLKNYAKPDDKIFDSHVGSGSIRIACHDMGFDFTGCEIDEDYYKDQETRFKNHTKQGDLFGGKELQRSIFDNN
jgi:site-specific DNA-methyltransferase (adenine-specific)